MKKIKNLFSSPLKGAAVILCSIVIVSLIALIAFVLGNSGSTIRAIGAEKAEHFALADAGIDPADAIINESDYSYDDGKFVYEVEFYSDGTEYDYLIDAETGAVVRKKQSLDDDYINSVQNTNAAVPQETTAAESTNAVPDQTQQQNSTQPAPSQNTDIGVDKAKEIALRAAGFTADEVTFKKAKFDYDDGYRLYEIEFTKGIIEYEYKINAEDGSVLEFDKDSIF